MKNYQHAVGIVTGALIVFITLIQFNVALPLIWTIFLISPIMILWMVWTVLIAPIVIEETFEEQWYQDRPDLKRLVEN